jgi:mono/diheme cytochrome c family protein
VTPVSAVPLIAPHAQAIDLSAGDPARGRSAFIALQCHACHRVAEDDSLPKVEEGWEGPLLDELGSESPEVVGWKIVTRTRLAPESIFESPMVESASEMTERQLVDLIAYLRNPAAGRRQ